MALNCHSSHRGTRLPRGRPTGSLVSSPNRWFKSTSHVARGNVVEHEGAVGQMALGPHGLDGGLAQIRSVTGASNRESPPSVCIPLIRLESLP
jgi:hypothetical protein